MPRPFLIALTGVCALAACDGARAPDVARFTEPDPSATSADIPAGADPDACYGRDETPATVETVTRPVLVKPALKASDGTILEPAVYRDETQQRIVDARTEIWFETPCPDEMTEDFVAALQRALAVRGLYDADITGQTNPATKRAVRAFQLGQGLNSSVLSIAAAKRLGLVVYDDTDTLETER